MKQNLSYFVAATVLAAPALAQGGDDCASATVLSNGVADTFDTTTATLTGPAFPCAGGGGPDRWFSYTAQNSGQLITAETCGSGYDTCIEIFDGSCATLTSIVCNDDACALQSSASVSGVAGTTYLIRVGGFSGAVGTGTILVTEAPDPCATPDAFEDNDDCATAAQVGDGVYAGLNVSQSDGDFFTFVIADGATLDVTADHLNTEGDIDLYLWDPLASCDSNVVGEGTAGGPLELAYTFNDIEAITYTNTSGAPLTVVLEVDIWDATSGPLCNPDYTLTVTGATPAGPGPIGSQACPANPNSTGVPAITTAFGETSVAANDVTLNSTDLPNGQFGLYVTSTTLVPAIPVNQGNLCLGGDLGRYQSNILQSDMNGEFSLTIDLAATPTTGADVAIQPGETRYWQAWYRDSSMTGATSNFTSAVEITFQ